MAIGEASINRLIKGLTAISFFLTTFLLILLFLNPIRQYELSIYEKTPLLCWIIILLNIFIGYFIIFLSILRNEKCVHIRSLLGIFVIVFNILIVQWLPFIRGYFSLSGDHMSQIGYAKDIILSGYFSPEDFYPITHILISEISIVTSIPTTPIGNYFTAITSIFSVISIFLIARSISYDSRIWIISTTVAGSVLFTGYELYLMPNGWSIHFIPLFIYLLFSSFKRYRLEFSICLVVFSILFTFFHPLASLFLISFLAVIAFVLLALEAKTKKRSLSKIRHFYPKPLNYILMLSVGFFAWVLAFKLFSHNIRTIWVAITSGKGPSFLDQLELGLAKLNMGTSQFLGYLWDKIGHILLILMISTVAFFLLVLLKNRLRVDLPLVLSLFFVFIFAGFVYIFTVFDIIPGLLAIAGDRAIAYLVIFTPIFVSLAYVALDMKMKRKKLLAFIFAAIIFVASAISIFAILPSPRLHEPNAGMTVSDTATFQWLFFEKDDSTTVSSIVSTPWKYAHFIYGYSAAKEVIPMKTITPDHFGYATGDEFVGPLLGVRYIATNEIDKMIYSTVWSPVGRFSESDFARLYHDSGIIKIYSNQHGDVWRSGVG